MLYDRGELLPVTTEPAVEVPLKLLPRESYDGVDEFDPIRYYFWPILGPMYRRRVELCLGECKPGKRVLEVGFGAGATFVNLHDLYQEIHGLDLSASVERVGEVYHRMGIDVHLRNGNVLDMPYEDSSFDTVLLISILEHVRPAELPRAFSEIARLLKVGGQVVYGVPINRPITTWAFRLLGHRISEHHFSTEVDVRNAASQALRGVRLVRMLSRPSFLGPVYEVGHFMKDRPRTG
ncbi:MAG: class I SAM-dependent methyltransferase [Desulfomonile tiedjei]|nr:class I SAM-dependent methyltransferase [Desulfomonile tiedjei]